MNRALAVVTILIVVIAATLAVTVWRVRFRVPFERRYDAARNDLELGLHAQALPVLQQAVRVYRGTPRQAEALYALARCESALDPTNTATWHAVLTVHTAALVRAEAQYHLAVTDPNRLATLRQYIETYPDAPWTAQAREELGEAAWSAGNREEAAAYWQRLLDAQPMSPEAARVVERLGQLNIAMLCSPRPLPFTDRYVIRRGDTLLAIAKQFTNTVDQLRRLNGLSHDNIAPGAGIRYDKSRYFILVDISDHILTLFRVWNQATNFVKRYSVGTGLYDNTPRGSFRIILRESQPTWYKPGSAPIPYGSKENLLGTRWLGIDCPGYGIHGTWEPDTIGRNSSAGCVRMLNQDVEELFDLVRVGTPVIIQD